MLVDRLVALERPAVSGPSVPHPLPAMLPAVPTSVPSSHPASPSPLQPVGSPGRHWQDVAAQRAGFDLTAWQPDNGFVANQKYVWGGYAYYRRMQVAHPALLWAGMAFGIGPTFASALQDLSVFNRYAGHFDRRDLMIPPAQLDAVDQARDLAGPATIARVSGDLERKLLEMQQAIFLDQGMQHEAWLGGGMTAIRELGTTGAIDQHAVAAWQQIDDGTRSGDQAMLERGNLELLRREQMQTIAGAYDDIRNLTSISPLVTYLLTAIGRPAIPGSHTAGQAIPVHVGPITLPLPAVDISRADDRWRMIQRDTWPAFTRLVDEHPSDYQGMLTTSLDQRIADGHFRHLPDSASLGDVAKFLAAALRRHLPVTADAIPR